MLKQIKSDLYCLFQKAEKVVYVLSDATLTTVIAGLPVGNRHPAIEQETQELLGFEHIICLLETLLTNRNQQLCLFKKFPENILIKSSQLVHATEEHKVFPQL